MFQLSFLNKPVSQHSLLTLISFGDNILVSQTRSPWFSPQLNIVSFFFFNVRAITGARSTKIIISAHMHGLKGLKTSLFVVWRVLYDTREPLSLRFQTGSYSNQSAH